MKTSQLSGLIIVVAMPLCILAGCSSSINAAQPIADASITYQDFYDDLSPYGTWISYPPYGNVWNPDLGVGFRPYATNGYWVYSSYGQMWVSGYSWGWAPFHYGRWIYDDFYGWLWVPGYEWSPAWVTWGYFDNFYGWAPLMPGINVGVSFNTYKPHSIYWNFVDRSRLYDPHIGTILINRDRINSFHNNITIINNFSRTATRNQMYSKGPEIGDVEKYTGGHIAPVRINDVKNVKESGERGNELNLYRPQVMRSQPRQFRQFDDQERPHPVISPDDRIIGPREEQRENINRLPVQRTPEMSIPRVYNRAPAVRESGRRR